MVSRRTARYLLAAATILAAGRPSSAVAQGGQRQTRILLLFQQLAETPPMVEFTQPLRLEVLRGLKGPVEFYQESLDLDRFPDREPSPQLKSYFENKYRGLGVDVVVPIGSRAFQFATDRLADVLPGVPIVFALSTAPQIDPATLPANVTGRLGVPSRFAPTLEMAQRLQPDAERVVIVSGASPSDSASAAAALYAVESSDKPLPVTPLFGLSLDALLKRLHTLPRRSIVLFANFRRDARGQVFEPIDLVGTMAHASAAPMYTQLGSYVGEGTVGGSVVRFDDEGARTGRLIRRVLARRPGEPMPPVEHLAKTFVADWRALHRWNLDERRLPAGTEVWFREPSLWARYRMEVLLTLSVIAVELALIGLLLLERRQRKRAQFAVLEQSAYEQMMARLTTDAVRHAPDDAPQALEDAVARIAEYAGASTATLVQYPDNGAGGPLRLTWTAPPGGHRNHAGPNGPPPDGAKDSRLEIPLVADETSIGTLELRRNDGIGWSAALIRRLESASELIASAMARSRAIRAIRRGEELNRAILASISTQIAILDDQGTIIRVNESWRRVAAEGVGELARQAFVGANYIEECRRAELRGCDEARDVRHGIEAVLARRASPFRYEYRCPDSPERWYEMFVDRLPLPEGGAILTQLDITDRRLAERHADETRRQVAHMGRMAFVGELAATISHELRQPLAAIRVNAEAGAQLLAVNPSDAAEAREIFQSIVADDARAVELIEGVRKLLRKEDAVTTIVDLNQVCRDAVRMLQHDADLRGTRLELALSSEPPLLSGDRVQLQQVVLNLALNGLEATNLSVADRFVTVATECDGGYVEVVVHDSGLGIPSDVQPHLFESFFSTKTGGLGLGLVIVRSIVERHNGRIAVANHPLGGAIFRVRLPLARRTPELATPAALSQARG